MEPRELDQVRKVIERSTSKVSLRDLEKKGFRKVKVLRSTDIDKMIERAVASALSRGEGNRQAIVESSRKALKEQMAQAKRTNEELAQLQGLNERLQQQNRELQGRAQTLQAQAEQLHRQNLELQGREHGVESRVRQLDEQQQQMRTALERAQARKQELERKLADSETARRRTVEAQAQDGAALGERLKQAEARASAAEGQLQKLSALRQEADELRSQVKQLETEKRLVEELEVPRLRQHIAEIEAQNRQMRSTGATAEDMRSVFRDLLQEMGTSASSSGGNADLADEFKKLHAALENVSVASVGGGGGVVDDSTAEARVKLSLDKLFQHDKVGELESNIENVQVKSKTGRGVGSALNKLKSIRKKNMGG